MGFLRSWSISCEKLDGSARLMPVVSVVNNTAPSHTGEGVGQLDGRLVGGGPLVGGSRVTVTEKLTSHCIIGGVVCPRSPLGVCRKFGWCKNWIGHR